MGNVDKAMRPPVLLIHCGADEGDARPLLNDVKLDVVACGAGETAAHLEHPALAAVLLAEGPRPSTSLTLLRKIKKERPELPVVYLAANTTQDGAAGAYRAGARVYLTRPVDPEELSGAVEALTALRSSNPGRRQPLALPERRPPSTLAGTDERLPEGLQRAVILMRRRLSERLSLDDLAAEAAMSRFHFCRRFRARFGRSPMRFLTELKIEKAKQLLLKEEMHISQVAERAGFADPSSFSKIFRRATGLSPSSFRRSAGEKRKKQ